MGYVLPEHTWDAYKVIIYGSEHVSPQAAGAHQMPSRNRLVSENGKYRFDGRRLTMARPEQNVDRVPRGEQEAFFESSAHTRAHPMAGLKTTLLVMHNFVGKQEHWLAASGDYFGSLGVGDNGVKDYPILDSAEREVFVVPSGRHQSVIEPQLSTN
jgi:hypothetical protein